MQQLIDMAICLLIGVIVVLLSFAIARSQEESLFLTATCTDGAAMFAVTNVGDDMADTMGYTVTVDGETYASGVLSLGHSDVVTLAASGGVAYRLTVAGELYEGTISQQCGYVVHLPVIGGK